MTIQASNLFCFKNTLRAKTPLIRPSGTFSPLAQGEGHQTMTSSKPPSVWSATFSTNTLAPAIAL
jgi:hypothetical protein